MKFAKQMFIPFNRTGSRSFAGGRRNAAGAKLCLETQSALPTLSPRRSRRYFKALIKEKCA